MNNLTKDLGKHNLKVSIFGLVMQLIYPILLFIFWEKGFIRLVAFVLSWVAWHNYWGKTARNLFK